VVGWHGYGGSFLSVMRGRLSSLAFEVAKPG
jgi:hypothetical protein